MARRLGVLVQINQGVYCLIQDSEDKHGFHFYVKDLDGYGGEAPEALGLVRGTKIRFDPDYLHDRAVNIEILIEPHIMMNGESVDLNQFSFNQRKFLIALRQLMDDIDRVGYFEVEDYGFGPNSSAVLGPWAYTPDCLLSPCFHVAEDMATQAGIKRGVMVAPDCEHLRVHYPRDGSTIGQQKAADILGMSWEEFRRLFHAEVFEKFQYPGCNVVVLMKKSVLEYREKLIREGRPLPQ